jgi:xanthosine utilization system XapX-like protein
MALDSTEGFSKIGDRGIALWEIVSVVSSCLIAEWTIDSLAGKASLIGIVPVLFALGFMLFSHRERGETLRDLGFRLDNFLPALRLLAVPTVIAIALILIGAWWVNGGHFAVRPARPRLLLVPIWALFQQYALQGFINRRAQLTFGTGPRNALVVALLFSLVHLPSPLLGVLALVGGYVWATVYQRQPNLFALAVSHAAASLTLSLAIPAHLSSYLRTGLKYFG